MTDWLTDLYAGSDEARFTDSESESWQSEAERSLHQTKHCLQRISGSLEAHTNGKRAS